MKIYLLLLSIGSIFFYACQSQEPVIYHTDGTTQVAGVPVLRRALKMIYRDTRGRYWFVNGMDEVYTWTEDSVMHYCALSAYGEENNIRSIQEDKEGNLFFDTDIGVLRMEGEDFVLLEVADRLAPGDWVSQTGDLWFTGGRGHKGAYRYDGEALYFMEFPDHPRAGEAAREYASYHTDLIYKDSKGGLWFSTQNQGFFYFLDGQLYGLYDKVLGVNPIGANYGWESVAEDGKGFLWINKPGVKIRVLESQDEGDLVLKPLRYERLPGIDDERIAAINSFLSVVYAEKSLWFSDNLGRIWQYDGKILRQREIMYFGAALSCHSLRVDREGRLWAFMPQTGHYYYEKDEFLRFTMSQK